MEESRWLSDAGRRAGARSSARTSSAPARSRSAAPTCASAGSARRSGPAASWPPRPATTRRGSRSPRSELGIKATVFMPEGAPIPKEKATRGYGADVVFQGRYLEDALVAARRFAEETGAVLIHPFDHARHRRRAGQRRARDPRAGARGRDRRRAHRRRRAARRHRARGEVAAARRPRGRRAGQGRRRLPGLARGRRAGAAASNEDDGRRHRGRPARRAHLRLPCASTSTRSSPSPRSRCHAPCSRSSSGRRWWSSRPAAPPSPRCSTPRPPTRRRWWPCSPAATSTRCCSGKVIQHGMAAAGRYLGLHVNIPDTPGGLATAAHRGERGRRQRDRGRPRAHLAVTEPRRGRRPAAARDPR